MKIRGSGDASAEATFDRTVKEAVRQAKLAAKNDPDFVPPADDGSTVIATRVFGYATPQRPPNAVTNASDMLAGRVFGDKSFGLALRHSYLDTPLVQHGATFAGTATVVTVAGRVNFSTTTTGAAFAAGDIGRSATNGLTVTSVTGSAYDFVLTGPGLAVIVRVPTGTVDLETLGTLKVTGAFGANGATPSTPSLGAALNAYAGGVFGLSAAADMQALVVKVAAIDAALQALGLGVP